MASPDDRDDVHGGSDRPGDGFEREAAIIRSLAEEPVELVDAPDDLWARIATTIEAGGRPDDRLDPGSPSGAPAATDELGRRRRSRTRWMIAVAAAAVVAVILGVGIVVLDADGGGTREVARAELTPYRGAPVGAAGGTVELVRAGDRDELRVQMHDLPAPAPGTFYELWLLDPSTGEPVSVATMRDGSSAVAATVEVPEGVDPARYDVVDVSVQEDSAGPEHSGNSVLRGTLQA